MNKNLDYSKIWSNIFCFQAFAPNCSALVDVLQGGLYNETVEEYVVENHVLMEKVTPTRQFVRSDGALYVLLIFLVLGIIMAGNALSVLWNLPRLFVQLTLYVILIGIGYFVYRKCLIGFRYSLTDRMLGIDRIVGKKSRPEAGVHLSDIVAIRPFGEVAEETGKVHGLYVNRKRDALAVIVSVGGKRQTLLINPSEEFTGKLMAQWKIARKK